MDKPSTILSQDFYKDLDSLLEEVGNYIKNTYGEHYVGSLNIQTLDVWDSLEILRSMCKGDAIKYISRYGRKAGNNPKDLLKVLHYTMILYYVDHIRGKQVDNVPQSPKSN